MSRKNTIGSPKLAWRDHSYNWNLFIYLLTMAHLISYAGGIHLAHLFDHGLDWNASLRIPIVLLVLIAPFFPRNKWVLLLFTLSCALKILTELPVVPNHRICLLLIDTLLFTLYIVAFWFCFCIT